MGNGCSLGTIPNTLQRLQTRQLSCRSTLIRRWRLFSTPCPRFVAGSMPTFMQCSTWAARSFTLSLITVLVRHLLGLKLVYTRLIDLVATRDHLVMPATFFETLPGGPQKLHLNPFFNQFFPCPTRCTVWASLCRFYSYCCLPAPPETVYCAIWSLPYSLS